LQAGHKGRAVNGTGRNVPLDSLEALAVASKIGAIDDIIQNLGMLIQNWIHETNRALSDGGAFFIELLPAH
jgi:hypothetical protein